MRIQSLRFGALDVSDGEVFTFPDGLVGMPQWKRFVLLENPGGGPLRWLQSVDAPALAFLVSDPLAFFPDYRVPVRAEDLAPIGLTDPSQGYVLVILTIGARAEETTANLLGPLVVDPAGRRGRQIVINDARFSTRHRILPEPAGGGRPC